MKQTIMIRYHKGRAEFLRGSTLLFTMPSTNDEEWADTQDMFKTVNEGGPLPVSVPLTPVLASALI